MSDYELKKVHHIDFPIALPDVPLEEQPDDTGFTAMEKLALRNVVSIAMRHYRKYAFEICLEFFFEHEEMLEAFRINRKSLNIVAIGHHARSVLLVYDRLINFGLQSSRHSHKTVSYIFERHLRIGVTAEEMKLMIVAINRHLMKIAATRCTSNLIMAFNKITEHIQSYFMKPEPVADSESME